MTVAFGTRDRVLLPGVARRRGQLPAHARWVKLAGSGHIAMFDDPQTVAALVRVTSRRSPAGDLRAS